MLALPSPASRARSATRHRRRQAAGTNTWYSPITSGVKKIGQAFDPKPAKTNSTEEDDSISLKAKAKPSADLYVAVGRVYQEAGNLPDAEQQYQAALKLSHNEHLGALLAYARLKEDLGQKNEALAFISRRPRRIRRTRRSTITPACSTRGRVGWTKRSRP